MRGIPLDAQTKEWFERRLHADLDHIRVHTYPAAHAAARMIGADAFAIGDDIFFAARRYQPRGAAGRELLAHELTHCLQQRLQRPRPQGEDLCEAEAREAARAVGRGAGWCCSVPDWPLQLRRAASIKPGSALITITQSAFVSTPTVTAKTKKNPPIIRAEFQCSTTLEADGSVVLTGSQPAVGWRIGFIQVEWVDTNWLHYRGRYDHDGSIFFQRSRPPSRPVKACRDVDPASDIFYDAGDLLAKVIPTDKFPLTLSIHHRDWPHDACDAVVVNSLTGQNNFLHDAQMEFLFCTVLSALDPAGQYHHLKSFYWNVRWQASFRPKDFAKPEGDWEVTPVKHGQGQATSGTIDGEPTDPRFKGILTDLSVPGCNSLIPYYSNMRPGHPCRRESKVWDCFDVRK